MLGAAAPLLQKDAKQMLSFLYKTSIFWSLFLLLDSQGWEKMNDSSPFFVEINGFAF